MRASELPHVSVVMAVYNSPELLENTIASVLQQEGVELEFIIIDDGSNAQTKAVLENYSANSEIQLITQENLGLTKSLIRGCSAAAAPYIARIDVGDEMLPGRLATQAARMTDDPSLAIVCSPVSLQTRDGLHLMDIDYSLESLEEGITNPSSPSGACPFHASVMFRRSFYQAVGGYRQEFHLAQDLDLWSRLIEKGHIAVTEKVLTTGVFLPNGLSAQFAQQQRQLKSLVGSLIAARQQHKDQAALLGQADAIRPTKMVSAHNNFAGNYFIGKCLLNTYPREARKYFYSALKANRFSLKTWWAVVQSLFIVGVDKSE